MSDEGTPACGARITEDTTLDADLLCPRGPALVVAADNVTLDLGGHRVAGSVAFGVGGPGIVLRGVSGVTVRNGTVERFEAGVVIEGGFGNTIEGLTVQDNIGAPDGELGDGIVVNESSGNRIEGNLVRRNGPFGGIALGPRAQSNEVRGNTVADNNMAHLGPERGRMAMGIRIEGPAADHNKITANTVTGSGCDGIVVLATCDDPDSEPPCAGTAPNQHNEIAENVASGNGTSGRGAGIRVFSMPMPVAPVHNVIRDNVADDNVWYGVAIDAPRARIGGEHRHPQPGPWQRRVRRLRRRSHAAVRRQRLGRQRLRHREPAVRRRPQRGTIWVTRFGPRARTSASADRRP